MCARPNFSGFSRGTVHYLPRPESDSDIALVRHIDEFHPHYPFAGSRMLQRLLGGEGLEPVRLHVATLTKKMGIEAIYHRPDTSRSALEHKIYRYPQRKLAVTRPNQVGNGPYHPHTAELRLALRHRQLV